MAYEDKGKERLPQDEHLRSMRKEKPKKKKKKA